MTNVPVAETPVLSAMPPEKPLSMPVQSFGMWDRKDERRPLAPAFRLRSLLKRLFVFGGTLALTGYGVYEMVQIVSVSRTTTLQWVLVFLFAATFFWIALAFVSSILGFYVLLLRRYRKLSDPERLSSHTALVMPVYNEGTERVFAAIKGIRESVEATGLGGHFSYILLSDSTNPDCWIAEEQAYLDLVTELGPDARVHYRHRTDNHQKKAGNISEFVRRWGGHYDFMLVLDADSIMTGQCITRMAAAMEADPDAGIIQSLPLIINRYTLFARLQQFAARVYGPVIAAGVASWSERDGNYWGHNAIIRVSAFAAHCGLPSLPGKPPFGGPVMSHDFIEAALMRRAGWSVYTLLGLRGSYEESPPSLADLAVRDRRWCQGNLQHTRILAARGLKAVTRHHLLNGIFSYLTSPLWLSQLLIGILLVWQATYIRPEYFNTNFGYFPIWPRFDAERALNLFIVTMAILLAPKCFGLIITLFHTRERRGCGGVLGMVVSFVLEIIMSSLIAPVLMIMQSRAVLEILARLDSGWNPQRRDDGPVAWRDVYRLHRWHTLLGIISGFSAFMISTSLFLWMSPTITGLILAIPLSWAGGRLSFGLALKRLGLLNTPEEINPPEILQRIQEHRKTLSAKGYASVDGLTALKLNPALRALHEALLPPKQQRERGAVDTDAAVAEAKIREAVSFNEIASWLGAGERKAVFRDVALLERVLNLPSAEPDRVTP
ncbi:MAG: glucans biosynthesis glucosyltransferase MdoH [Methylobacteriaceae bacterium]|jgi:membrane glycosyltransferase|nr:glucans biosynthesis glucosyltransferase MdoH [Methylobacteriaceae bacterium]